ncbi:MAG: adenylyltransferase/cytidyltransferase family protein [Candidatus Altiarchaeota archaeon]
MVLVVATGVFEVLHPGHLLYLSESRRLGDRLVVIIASDRTAGDRKGVVHIPEGQRLEVVKSLKSVDDAVIGDPDDMLKPIRELKPDIVTLGPDQSFTIEEVEDMLRKAGVEARVVRIQSKWDGGLNSSKKIKRLYFKGE